MFKSIFSKCIQKMVMVVAVFCMSCNTEKKDQSPIQLKNNVVVDESNNAVLHWIPPFVHNFSDSLISFWSGGAMDYNIYNIYTGKIVGSVVLDTATIPYLLHLRKSISARKYKYCSLEEYKKRSLAPFKIYCLKPDDYKDVIHLFFALNTSFDSTISIEGKTMPATYMAILGFSAIYNFKTGVVSDYKNIDIGNEDPLFMESVFQLKNKFYTGNIRAISDNNQYNKHGMLAATLIEGEGYITKNVSLTFDKKAQMDYNAHKVKTMRFSRKNDSCFFVSDGYRLMQCCGDRFEELKFSFSNQYIQELYYDTKKELLYVATNSDNEDNVQSKLYSINLPERKIVVLKKWAARQGITFINETTFVSVSQNQQSKKYEFSVYNLK